MLEPNNPVYYKAKSIYDFRVSDLCDQHIKLDIYKGCVCIIVNTATKCKLTDIHYRQFNELMDKYGESQGLRILAFPCNQFEEEEPCTNDEIFHHAEEHNVTFDIFAKVNVNCSKAIPLYKFLKKRLGNCKVGDMIKCNYTKFIINRAGKPVKRYGIDMLPNAMEEVLSIYFGQHYKSKTENIMPKMKLEDVEIEITKELHDNEEIEMKNTTESQIKP